MLRARAWPPGQHSALTAAFRKQLNNTATLLSKTPGYTEISSSCFHSVHHPDIRLFCSRASEETAGPPHLALCVQRQIWPRLTASLPLPFHGFPSQADLPVPLAHPFISLPYMIPADIHFMLFKILKAISRLFAPPAVHPSAVIRYICDI